MGLSPIKRLLSKAKLGSDEGLEHEPQGLLPEPLFLRALCLERKRAERSRKPFVLMLLEARDPFQDGNEDNVFDKTVAAIHSSIRETDLAGWYKVNFTLGVIFTELGLADKKSILAALRLKAA